MKNISFTLDDNTFSKAEEKAVALHTSLGEVAADFVRQWVAVEAGLDQARQRMAAMFAHPTWRFAVGTPDNRTLRNARR